MAKNDWMMWIAGIGIAALAYFYITSQKAGGGTIDSGETPPAEANVAHTGCGCGR